eukprot:3786352-Lingulodinium_polyedra.AAC.1
MSMVKGGDRPGGAIPIGWERGCLNSMPLSRRKPPLSTTAPSSGPRPGRPTLSSLSGPTCGGRFSTGIR